MFSPAVVHHARQRTVSGRNPVLTYRYSYSVDTLPVAFGIQLPELINFHANIEVERYWEIVKKDDLLELHFTS
jgi:hypothetical protein